jgi:membrane protein implicated in regulation of membrane protease activity
MGAKQEAKEERTAVYGAYEACRMGNRMVMSLLFVLLLMNALAVIIIAPWIFVVTTAFGLVMYVVLSLAFLIFFGVPFFEYKLILGYMRGESNDRKDENSRAGNAAGKAKKAIDP